MDLSTTSRSSLNDSVASTSSKAKGKSKKIASSKTKDSLASLTSLLMYGQKKKKAKCDLINGNDAITKLEQVDKNLDGELEAAQKLDETIGTMEAEIVKLRNQ
ncbi:hypothetical protein JTB14_007123 [Gonioctena quinquepunctata]|nr:hypothetical protein JTB14_007123 [Gonioctena quinquepunctata]